MRLAALILLTLGTAHAQETIQYGPWVGYWQQASLSAYSPQDSLDAAYRRTKGRWLHICADGRTDVRAVPYGIAAPSRVPFGTRILIPSGHGYLDSSRPGAHERIFVVSDRGGLIERRDSPQQRMALDLRYKSEESALAFGIKDAWVFIITSDAKPPSAEMK